MKILLCLLMASNYVLGSTLEGVIPDYRGSKVFNLDEKSSDYIDVKLEKTYFNIRVNSKKKRRQFKRYKNALNLLERVMNSAEFKKRVINYERQVGVDENNKPIMERSYAKNYLWKNEDQRLTNEQIYDILILGDEKMRENTQGVMNINSRVKRSWSRKVVGYTNPSSSEFMTLNWHFYKNFKEHQMVANIVHEWIHLLGFLHGPRATMRQEVPYIVGFIAGEIAKEILEQEKLSDKF